MKKIFITIYGILLIGVTYGQSDRYQINFENGNKAIENKDYPRAIKFLTIAIKEWGNSDVYFNRATAYLYLGDTCKFCDDLKSASDRHDFEAKKLYFEKCSYLIYKQIVDSINRSGYGLKSISTIHSKCHSDSVLLKIMDHLKQPVQEDDFWVPLNSDIYTTVEEMPSYPGGEDARNQFIANNIVYPPIAINAGIQGTVHIKFILDKEGIVQDVRLVRGIGGGCDEEAIRLVKLMPKWNPGKEKGKVVNVMFNMPVYFNLQNLPNEN